MGFLKQLFHSFTRTERIIFLGAAMMFCIGIITIVGWEFSQKSPLPFSRATFIEGVVGQPKNPNPILATSDTDRALVRLLFSTLTDVASKIEEKPDTTPASAWRIRLRDNVYWHDGKRLTSDDVIFTIARIQEDGSVSPLASVWRGVKVTRVSEIELEITLPAPYVFFPENFSNLFIVPKHIYADVPTSNWHLSDYHLKPVGSGMYQFASYDRLANGFISTFQLTASPRYFGEHPALSALTLAFYPNATELYRAYDIGVLDAFSAPDASYSNTITREYTAHSFTVPTYYALFFNQSKSKPLADTRVRTALSLAINKDRLVKDALLGNATPLSFPLLSTLPPTQPSAPSLDQAQALLDDAGYLTTASGTRMKVEKTAKTPLAFTLITPDVPFLKKTAELIAEDLVHIGASVTVSVAPIADITAGAIKNRDYEILLFGNSLGPTNDLFAFWHSSARFSPGLNISMYNNKQIDTLLETVRRTPTESGRTTQLERIRTTITQDVPVVFLFTPFYTYVTATTITGNFANTLSHPADRFQTISSWHKKGLW